MYPHENKIAKFTNIEIREMRGRAARSAHPALLTARGANIDQLNGHAAGGVNGK